MKLKSKKVIVDVELLPVTKRTPPKPVKRKKNYSKFNKKDYGINRLNIDGLRKEYPAYVNKRNKVDWNKLTRELATKLTTQFIYRHQEYLNWDTLTEKRKFTESELELFQQRIKWKKMKTVDIPEKSLLRVTVLDWSELFKTRTDFSVKFIMEKGHLADCRIRSKHITLPLAEKFEYQLDWDWTVVNGKIDKNVFIKYENHIDFYWASVHQDKLPIRFVANKYDQVIDRKRFVSKNKKRIPFSFLVKYATEIDWDEYLKDPKNTLKPYMNRLSNLLEIIPNTWRDKNYNVSTRMDKFFKILPKDMMLDEIEDMSSYDAIIHYLGLIDDSVTLIKAITDLFEYDLFCGRCEHCYMSDSESSETEISHEEYNEVESEIQSDHPVVKCNNICKCHRMSKEHLQDYYFKKILTNVLKDKDLITWFGCFNALLPNKADDINWLSKVEWSDYCSNLPKDFEKMLIMREYLKKPKKSTPKPKKSTPKPKRNTLIPRVDLTTESDESESYSYSYYSEYESDKPVSESVSYSYSYYSEYDTDSDEVEWSTND